MAPPPPPPRAVLVVRNAACLCPMDDARRVVLDEGAVAVRGDRIVAVSPDPLAGREALDARGLVVSPGFVDLHRHAHGLTSSRTVPHIGHDNLHGCNTTPPS